MDVDSLTKDKVAFMFFEREAEHLQNTTGKKWRKTEGEAEKEQIDLVVRWRMPQIGKSGFTTLFGVQLLKEKNKVTILANKIMEAQQTHAQRVRPALGESARMTSSRTRRANLCDQKIVPIRVTFDYEQHIQHHFTE